jgi:hypothetical protein
VQKKAAIFENHTNDPVWVTLAQCRMIAHICAHFKAYTREWAWKAIWAGMIMIGELGPRNKEQI